MAFSSRKWRAPAAVSMPGPVPFAAEGMTGSGAGRSKAKVGTGGADNADDPAMQSSTLEIIDT